MHRHQEAYDANAPDRCLSHEVLHHAPDSGTGRATYHSDLSEPLLTNGDPSSCPLRLLRRLSRVGVDMPQV